MPPRVWLEVLDQGPGNPSQDDDGVTGIYATLDDHQVSPRRRLPAYAFTFSSFVP